MSRTRTRTRRLKLDTLENRLAPASQLTATLDLTDHVLRIEGTDQTDNIQVRHANGRVSIDGINIRVVDIDLIGDFESVTDADVAAVDVKALDGDDLVRVEDLADGTSLTIHAGLGSDQTGINEGTAWGPLTFDGGGGYTDYLYVNDFRPGPNTYTVTTSAITGNGLSLAYANVSNLFVLSNNVAADTFAVQSTPANTHVHLWGYGGVDAFRVGGPAGLDQIRGSVFASGMDGADSLTIDNSDGSSATRLEIGPGSTRLPWGTFIDYNQAVEALTVRGGAIDETFVLTGSTPEVPLTLDGGGGANTLEYVENPGLVAWYSGEGTAADIAGGHHGVAVTAVGFGAGRVGQAFQLSGSESPGHVRVPNAPDLEPATVSVEAWVNSTNINDYGAYSYIVSKGAADFRGASYALVTSITGGLWFYVGNGSAFAYSPDPGTGVWDGNWHHVVGTYDGSVVRLFVDGVEIGSGNRQDNSLGYGLETTNDLYIGTYGGLDGYTFEGRIDEPSVYDRALTPGEVQALFVNGKASPWAHGVQVNLPAGTATGVAGGISNIRHVTGASGNDTLAGDGLDNQLSGRAGNDTLAGAGGADVLDGGAGSDRMLGGAGINTYTFAAAPAEESDTVVETFAQGRARLDFSRLAADDPVSVNLAGNVGLARHTRRGVVNGAGGTTSAFYQVVGGAGDDMILGNNRNNEILGGPGNDTLTGANGKDTLLGEAGNDSLIGGAQDDVLGGGIGNDRLEGQEGGDWLFGEDGDDTIVGGLGGDFMVGEAGNDRLSGEEGKDYYYGGDGNDICWDNGDTADSFDGGAGSDHMQDVGLGGNDTMRGGPGNDTIEGGGGRDDISGEDGNDDLWGGYGDDTLRGQNGNDRLFGGPRGTERPAGESDNDLVEGGFGDDLVEGGHNLSTSFGIFNRDQLFGNEGDDTVLGGKGRELLNGGPGNDTLWGYENKDTINAGDGWEDLVYPGLGADNVFADSFDRVMDISEVFSMSPTEGDAPVALQPGTLVTIQGADLAANARVQFGGSYTIDAVAAYGTEVTVSADRTTITARVPRGAMSGTVWVIDPRDQANPDDDTWESAPGWFTVRTFRNTYGFQFQNFGFNVSVPLMQDSFGVEQTNIRFGPVITPIPKLETLALTALAALAFNDKGACFGMAQMSQRLARNPEWINSALGLPPFSAPTVFNLTPTGELINLIERVHLHQFSQELINYTINWKLGSHTKASVYNQIRDRLLAGDRPLISFQNGIGKGHVVVAYDLEWALDTPEADDYYIHTYDSNRPYGSTKTSTGITLDSAAMNGQKIADSRIYVGSNGLSSGNEWRFKMGNEFWAGGFGDLMVVPYETVPVNPTFPGSLPSLLDLILGTHVTPTPAADGLLTEPADPIRLMTPAVVSERPAQTMVAVPPVPVADAADAPMPSPVSWEGLLKTDELQLVVG